MANNLFKWDKIGENSGILGFGGHLGCHLEYLIFPKGAATAPIITLNSASQGYIFSKKTLEGPYFWGFFSATGLEGRFSCTPEYLTCLF